MSNLTDNIKRRFFKAAVVSILLYGCTTWTLTKGMEKNLDGYYARMLRVVFNKSWRQHPTKQQLFRYLPPIRKTIQVREHAGHYWRSRDDIQQWVPSHGQAKPGQPARTYTQLLCTNTGCSLEDPLGALNDRER